MVEALRLASSAPSQDMIPSRRAQDRLVREAMLLIERNLMETVPLSRLWKSFGISARQIERRFLSDVGLTPREYRLRLRLIRAKWMIENTDLSITEIGLECGFADCAHFSRTYRSRFDVSPSMLRRRMTEIVRAAA